ncbi:MAG: CoA transferase [Gemmatimonadota bacterium]
MGFLDGTRVLDFTQNLAGPTCTQILAELGAEVVKVEPTDGDSARAWGPPFSGGDAAIFRAVNHGKRSVTLDLKRADDLTVARTMLEDADILVESFRPGVMDRLGLGAEVVCAAHPRLIYASISAYGERGPLGSEPGFDALMQAHAGLVSVTGHPGAPVRSGASIVDTATALWTVIGILAALRQRERTGRGTHLRAALFEAGLAYSAYYIAGFLADGKVPGPQGNTFPLIAPYGEFPTADGRIVIAPASDRLFGRLCTALGLESVAADPRFATNPDRVAAREEVRRIVSRKTAALSTADLMGVLREEGIPCAPVLDMSEVCEDPQTVASRALVGDRVLPPLTWNGDRASEAGDVPALGEHTDAARAGAAWAPPGDGEQKDEGADGDQ